MSLKSVCWQTFWGRSESGTVLMTLQLFCGDDCLWTHVLDDPKTNMPLNQSVLIRAKAGQTLKASITKKSVWNNFFVPKPTFEPQVRGLLWHGQVTVMALKDDKNMVVGSYKWEAASEPVSGAWSLTSETKNHQEECPVILVDFLPVALPSGQSTVMSQGGKSWQMVGSAPVEDVRTNVTREEQTNVMGPRPSPTDVALADVKAGLLAGPRSSVSAAAAGATSPSAKNANKSNIELDPEDDINFYDSVSQVAGLGGYKAQRGILHQSAPSNLTEASSVPPSVAKKACDINTVNLNALVARFMVDMRVFEWQPQSIEEYLAIGQVPQGLALSGQATINGLALGFDNTAHVMDYDRESQIYTNATWSRHLVKATAIIIFLSPSKMIVGQIAFGKYVTIFFLSHNHFSSFQDSAWVGISLWKRSSVCPCEARCCQPPPATSGPWSSDCWEVGQAGDWWRDGLWTMPGYVGLSAGQAGSEDPGDEVWHGDHWVASRHRWGSKLLRPRQPVLAHDQDGFVGSQCLAGCRSAVFGPPWSSNNRGSANGRKQQGDWVGKQPTLADLLWENVPVSRDGWLSVEPSQRDPGHVHSAVFAGRLSVCGQQRPPCFLGKWSFGPVDRRWPRPKAQLVGCCGWDVLHPHGWHCRWWHHGNGPLVQVWHEPGQLAAQQHRSGGPWWRCDSLQSWIVMKNIHPRCFCFFSRSQKTNLSLWIVPQSLGIDFFGFS